LEKLRGEGFTVSFTMEDFNRQYIKEHFAQLTPAEQREALERLSPEHRREVLRSLPPEERLEGLSPEARLAGLSLEARLAGLSEEQVRQLLDQLAAGREAQPRKSRRKRKR
jgi:Mg/Co/Ni transporter MgtE